MRAERRRVVYSGDDTKPDQRCVTIDGVESCKTAIQTNNVEVDDRGFVYLVARANTGASHC